MLSRLPEHECGIGATIAINGNHSRRITLVVDTVTID